MLCSVCGRNIANDAKFCSFCGSRVVSGAPEKVCPSCGWRGDKKSVYCAQCGTLLASQSSAPPKQAAPRNAPPLYSARSGPGHIVVGRLIKEAKMFSMYKGEPTLGVAVATGDLCIYDDHLEMKKTIGNPIGGLINVIKAQSPPPLTFPYGAMSTVRVGKYGGVYNSLVIQMKSGEVTSFVPAVPSSSLPEELASVIRRYL